MPRQVRGVGSRPNRDKRGRGEIPGGARVTRLESHAASHDGASHVQHKGGATKPAAALFLTRDPPSGRKPESGPRSAEEDAPVGCFVPLG